MRALRLTILSYIRYMFGIYQRPTRYDHLFEHVDSLKAKNIMEIGTWKGARAKGMIETAAKHRPVGEVHYYGFDLFHTMDPDTYAKEISKQPPSRADIEKELQATGAVIHLFEGDTTKTLPAAVATLPKMDFIYIDGGHSYETILSDWENSAKLMHETTAVVFDDYWENRKDGAGPIVDKIDKTKYNVELLPAMDVFFNPDFGRLVIRFAKVTKL